VASSGGRIGIDRTGIAAYAAQTAGLLDR